MPLQASFTKKVFQFNFKARTSRGLMRDKTSWFIKVWDDSDPSVKCIGECGPLPDLSIDARPDFEEVLQTVINNIIQHQPALHYRFGGQATQHTHTSTP